MKAGVFSQAYILHFSIVDAWSLYYITLDLWVISISLNPAEGSNNTVVRCEFLNKKLTVPITQIKWETWLEKRTWHLAATVTVPLSNILNPQVLQPELLSTNARKNHKSFFVCHCRTSCCEASYSGKRCSVYVASRIFFVGVGVAGGWPHFLIFKLLPMDLPE